MYHWTRQLQVTIYNTTYNIWTATQYNVVNNNTKFKDQLEVEFVTTAIYTSIYIYIYIYEVWNFNSGNYLFTTDTK